MKIDVSRKFPEHFDTLVVIHEEDGKIQLSEWQKPRAGNPLRCGQKRRAKLHENP